LINALVFSAIWGIGGCIDETTRPNFDIFFQDLLIGENVIEKYKVDLRDVKHDAMKIPNKMGDYKSLFDVFFDQGEMKWINWFNTVDRYVIDKEMSYLQLSIPTIDSIRVSNICRTLLLNDKHCLLVGPTGTGKSVSMNQLLKDNFDNEGWTFFPIGFSA
jgi:dynein heavy chain